jgi:hypothetical protein
MLPVAESERLLSEELQRERRAQCHEHIRRIVRDANFEVEVDAGVAVDLKTIPK